MGQNAWPVARLDQPHAGNFVANVLNRSGRARFVSLLAYGLYDTCPDPAAAFREFAKAA
jgi:hypothetical protein